MKENLLLRLRSGEKLNTRQQVAMILQLSLPAIFAQLSSIVMQYIDASMVGQLGAQQSASIGLVSSSTWLFNGICNAAITGFSVQVAQRIGAGRDKDARSVMKQGFVVALGISLLLCALGSGVSGKLPEWLGGNADICADASRYFLIYALALPFAQLNNISAAMLQASGNMKTPSVLFVVMCLLDVVFNFFLIFPTRQFGGITVFGADLGVSGASLGTALSHVVIALVMTLILLVRSDSLHLRRKERLPMIGETLRNAAKIGIPVGIEQLIMSGAQVMGTRIVAPLGTVAIAANSFAITAESLCYMPGYGIGNAATTLIGQSIGAKRYDLTRRLGWLTTGLGMLVMGLAAVLMFIFAPFMIGIMTPDPSVVELGAQVLRIAAFVEPFYAASIVANGVFRGAGNTLVPSCLNFVSMWAVRLPLAAVLSVQYGLKGYWFAMCIELFVRGVLFLLRLKSKKWMQAGSKN
ncbi:MAG: MATE family efflux transporter [Ruminococcaceae bacterium]|nr:MATE family efflux transporter [Oscillospiraceae bacterium]